MELRKPEYDRPDLSEVITLGAILTAAETAAVAMIEANEFEQLFETGRTQDGMRVRAMYTYSEFRASVQDGLDTLQLGKIPFVVEEPITIGELRDRNSAVAIVTSNPNDQDVIDAHGLTIFWGYEGAGKGKTKFFATTINIGRRDEKGRGKFKKKLDPPSLEMFPGVVSYKTRHLILPDTFEFIPENLGKISEEEEVFVGVDFEGAETVAGRRAKRIVKAAGAVVAVAVGLFATTKLALRARRS